MAIGRYECVSPVGWFFWSSLDPQHSLKSFWIPEIHTEIKPPTHEEVTALGACETGGSGHLDCKDFKQGLI